MKPRRIDKAKYEGGWLMLQTDSPDAKRFVYRFKAGRYELNKQTEKRSLDANGMAWALIHQIAAAANIPPIEVYREAVRNLGGVSEVICIQKKAVDKFKRLFIGDHVGRQICEMESKIPGCITLICTYGSSDYNTRQMSALIDNLIQDAKSLGIETPDDERINSLLEDWEGRKSSE